MADPQSVPDDAPIVPDRSADDSDQGWGDPGDAIATEPVSSPPIAGADAASRARAERARRESDPDVRRLLDDKPPHWS